MSLITRVLLAYGGGSVKKNGIYDAVLAQFGKASLSHVELSGIKPNPRVESEGGHHHSMAGIADILSRGNIMWASSMALEGSSARQAHARFPSARHGPRTLDQV